MAAIDKQILKNTRTETVIKLVGTGTMAITLAELALADETFDAASASVDIRKVTVSAPPTQETKVDRNSVDILQVFGSVDWTFEGMKINQETNHDFSVITAGDGTVILTLRKNAGYAAPGRSSYLTNGA